MEAPRDLEEIPLNSCKSFTSVYFAITQLRSYREIIQPRWLSRIYGVISRYSGFSVAGSLVKRNFHRVQRQLQINQGADDCYQKQGQTRKQKLQSRFRFMYGRGIMLEELATA